ncbi:MAG: diaminopimelate decarboxylase [Geodermatophilaceae bacterium]|nr:diaminopimelate decarboxylase [Geodermatophilaceae bacterium]
MRVHPAGPLHGGLTSPEILRPPPVSLNALETKVWPRSAQRNEGALWLGGIDIRELAAQFGTPAYIVDEADFRSRCREHRMAFAEADVYYAAKAFLCTAVARWVAEEGLGLDVCTSGELATALRAGFPAERIAMHGNNKSTAELTAAVGAGIGRIVLDSGQEIDRLAAVARRYGVRQPVLVRVTVGVEAHTHEFIATAHEDQKFGFSLASGQAFDAVRRVAGLDTLELVGVHSHIGSQIFDTEAFEVSAHRLVQLLERVRDELALELPELGLGGGLGIAYTAADDPMETGAFAVGLTAIVRRECAARGLTVPRLSVEPGRALAGPGGVTLYEVGTVKDVDGLRTYVSVDGGMSDNIRTALYDAEYTVVLASRTSDAGAMLTRVVGKHCESGDIVVRDAWLPADVEPGDLLAVAGTGAYCRSMSSNYNQLPRPPVISVHNGQSTVLVRRETEDDLLRLDVAR